MKNITEINLQKIVRKVLNETTWEEITKMGADVAKKIGNTYIKNAEEESKKLNNKPNSSSSKSIYDKNKDVLFKDLPEFTITATKPKNNYDALLIGGLDIRRGDLSIEQQVNSLKTSFGQTKRIKGLRYNTNAAAVNKILNENPGIYVFMFSAGCTLALDVANNKNVNKNKVYIIEPYGLSKNTRNIVNAAVNRGVPKTNVFVGPDAGRGLGIVSGSSTTKKGLTHWQALSDIGNRI